MTKSYHDIPHGWDDEAQRVRFSSLAAMAEQAKALNKEGFYPWDDSPYSAERNDDWVGNASFYDVHDFAMNGWTEGARRADDLAGEIATKVEKEMVRRPGKRKTGVRGKRVRAGRYAAGNPRCLVRRPRQPIPRNGRVVHLHVGMAAMADVTGDGIMRRGAAILGLGITLAARGYRLRVTSEATSRSSYNRRHYSILVDLQSPSQPLDPGTLALALAHPGYFRHLGFTLRAGSQAWGGRCGGEGRTIHKNEWTPEGAINLNPAKSGEKVVTDPVGWIIDVLERIEK